MSRLSGKIAIITGASSGIGLATARTFLNEGAARIYITGRREAELKLAIASLGERAIAVQGDVTDTADLDRLYNRVASDAGRIDVVFANAGFGKSAPLGSLTKAHVDELLNTNIKGVIWTVQKALPLMGAGGSIILNASIAGSKGLAGWSVYSATKAAIRSFARTWSSDLKGKDIRVNVISPGVIETPGHGVSGATQEELAGFFGFAASVTPLARIGREEEVARVVAFLASDDSSFMNGSEVFVDGGLAQV